MSKNKNVIIIGVIAFVAGLFLGIINPFRGEQVAPDKQAQNYKKELINKQNELSSLQSKYDELENKKTPTKSVSQVDTTTAKKFFETLLSYNQSQYKTRFEEALKYGTQEAVDAFNPEGANINMPSEEVQAYVSEFNYYGSSSDPSQGVVMVTYGMRTGAGNNKVTGEWNVKLDASGKVDSVSKKRFTENIE